jgi:UDP-glucose 4-epimerase
MKVLVTGGAGYVGWSVIHALAASPDVSEIVVYDNFARGNYGLLLGDKLAGSTRIRIVVDDILNSRALKRAMADIDCVAHLAAIAPSPYSDDNPHTFDQVNHWGTAEVCYAVEAAGVPRLVYLSSGAIYGHSDTPVGTDAIPMPVNAYGRSKLAGEKQVQRLGDQREVAIIRSGTVYGVNPAARFDTFANRFLLDAALNRPLQINGSGEQVRPIIGVDNLAERVGAAVTGRRSSMISHAVEENISVSEAVDALQNPSAPLDVIYINQQQRLSDLRVTPSDGSNPDGWDEGCAFNKRMVADRNRLMVAG